MKRIVVLGSTGSIGRNALDVIRALGPDYRAVGLSAAGRWELLAEQVRQFRPAVAVVADSEKAELLRQNLGQCSTEVLADVNGLERLASLPEADIVLVGISGAAALMPALASLRARKQLALANKECLVMAGELVMHQAKESGVQIVPVDSEHSGVFQMMRSGRRSEVRKIVLTASGGPFWSWPASRLAHVTPVEALHHPNWSMGQKITIDSATMMNKALEIVEARWLFGVDVDQIRVVIHPESIVHSAVEFCDGVLLAQLGMPDMRVPIQYGLTYPERLNGQASQLDLAKLGKLSFYEPDTARFPALALGYRAARAGGTMGAVLNAANETAVEGFLTNQISFTEITRIAERVMDAHRVTERPELEQILEADRWARQETLRCLGA